MSRVLLRLCLMLALVHAACKQCDIGGVYCETGYACVEGVCELATGITDAGADLQSQPDTAIGPDRASDDGQSDGLPTDTLPLDGGEDGSLPSDGAVDGPDAGPSIRCPDGMVGLPGGTFVTAVTLEEVSVEPFCLHRIEVTVEGYIGGGGFVGDLSTCPANFGTPGLDKHPMNCVSFTEAVGFCQTIDGRLPSENEWEWAARSTTEGSIYPWGDENPAEANPERLCWSGGPGGMRVETCTGGTFSPQGDSAEGVADLAGNLTEWTSTSETAFDRVVRGGSFADDASTSESVEAGTRDTRDFSFRSGLVGFRCAADPLP